MKTSPLTRRWLAGGVALGLSLSPTGSAVPSGDAVSLGTRLAEPQPGSADSGDSLFPHQGNGGYEVDHYRIDLHWSRPDSIMSLAHLKASATQNLSAFNLDLRGLRVSSVRVDGSRATYRRNGSELTITPASSIVDGSSFEVLVRYRGTPQTFIDPDGAKDGWIQTPDGATVLSEPVGAMTWFPNNNTPRDKATFGITVTAPRRLEVVSNGRLVSTSTHAGTRTWHWREMDQMSSYLATVSIGEYDVLHDRSRRGVPVVSYLDPTVGGVDAARRVPGVIDYWEKLFGPYPFTSSGMIVDNVEVGYALEVQTRPVFPSVPGISLIVHEFAHQWFGDSVTLTDWSDIWLHEGFATYAEWLWEARHHPAYPAHRFRQLYRGHPAADPFWNIPVAVPGEPANLFGNAVYTRGAMALQAIRMRMGDRAFFRLLRRWPAVHRQGNVATADLQALAERLSGKRLDHVFRIWLYEAKKPRGY